MTQDSDERRPWVTNAELEEKLDKVPTRWEVRFLILAAFIGGQVIPSLHSPTIQTGAAFVKGWFT